MKGRAMGTRDIWCRHRTAFTEDIKVCKAGVDFHQFPMRRELPVMPAGKVFAHLEPGDLPSPMPCLGETQEARDRCPQFSAWTQEEIDARKKELGKRFERIGKIRKAIIEVTLNKGGGGKIPCPCCGGIVHYSQASNKHVHATCSTPGCASWME